jgi:hypothetical protein
VGVTEDSRNQGRGYGSFPEGAEPTDQFAAHETSGDRSAGLTPSGTPQRPAVPQQRPTSPAAYDQRPTSPAAYHQRPTSPAAYYQRPTAPAAYDQRPTSPAAHPWSGPPTRRILHATTDNTPTGDAPAGRAASSATPGDVDPWDPRATQPTTIGAEGGTGQHDLDSWESPEVAADAGYPRAGRYPGSAPRDAAHLDPTADESILDEDPRLARPSRLVAGETAPAVGAAGTTSAVSARGVTPAVGAGGTTPAVNAWGATPAVGAEGTTPAVSARGMAAEGTGAGGTGAGETAAGGVAPGEAAPDVDPRESFAEWSGLDLGDQDPAARTAWPQSADATDDARAPSPTRNEPADPVSPWATTSTEARSAWSAADPSDPFGLPATAGPRIEPTPPTPPPTRLFTGLLIGLVVGLLLFGAGGWFLGRTATTTPETDTPAQQPPALGLFEQNQAVLNQKDFRGTSLTKIAQGWLPYLSTCGRGAARTGDGEKVRVRCTIEGMSALFVEYKSVADRDKARTGTLDQAKDSNNLAPGVGAEVASRVTPSRRTTGDYAEYAFKLTEGGVTRTVAGIWWDDAQTPIAAYLLAYWKDGVGERWEPMRDLWSRYA